MPRRRAAELVSFGKRSVIVVNPTKTLERRTGVVLVPLSDGRALISFDESMTAARLELMIQDALDEHDLPDEDTRIFEAIRDVLRNTRRSPAAVIRQQYIMVIEVEPAAAASRKNGDGRPRPPRSRG